MLAKAEQREGQGSLNYDCNKESHFIKFEVANTNLNYV